VDESGIDQYLHRQEGRAPKVERVFGSVSGKKFRRTNIVAGYVNGKTIAECVYDCTTDGEVFNAWVEQSLVPALQPGQVVVMDNAAFHKHRRTRDAIEAAGCSLVFLPPPIIQIPIPSKNFGLNSNENSGISCLFSLPSAMHFTMLFLCLS
jgi:hypothetical protein